MVINEGVKAVIEGSAFLSLVTLGADGIPHPIIVGKGEVVGDTVVFGIYKMDVTQQNLAADKNIWVVAATMDGGPKGYRLNGTAEVKDKKLIFTPAKVDALI
ncbi:MULTISPECIES: pyridoxamine 5'-phosphate oxidase family protein [unclassified Dehalobacter]|jgi:Pyridoxamine 5''-phosphate oxidase.|uniref:pyridoxamine 5'-phosphate oxidase family protein n=1 Tax=unclassified Dehalobacter TaxID=2635733 RepID=UPI00028AA13B|nr:MULTISPECIES: pyridoxamine 5'-phosphate oxidase family protein [unclassified Dehalobacter]AFV02162.1 Pyridoxamine 5''-phosphate oxidase [Dehalobacter sp. DCA]AFV05207.1 Pyridoxamine 5''-phosphate oxidase [Dehalobacter sp. CF]